METFVRYRFRIIAAAIFLFGAIFAAQFMIRSAFIKPAVVAQITQKQPVPVESTVTVEESAVEVDDDIKRLNCDKRCQGNTAFAKAMRARGTPVKSAKPKKTADPPRGETPPDSDLSGFRRE